MRILLAEDDARLAEPLRDFLARDQHVVTWVDHGGRALEEILASDYDLALLDWMLPGRDGLAIVTELRRRQRPTLVLMLTARDALEDVVQGLQAGADDYLVKPFRMAELAARIRSLERRATRPYSGLELHWGPLTLEVEAALLRVHGREVPLTSKEYQLLEWFLRHPGQLARMALRLAAHQPGAGTPGESPASAGSGHGGGHRPGDGAQRHQPARGRWSRGASAAAL